MRITDSHKSDKYYRLRDKKWARLPPAAVKAILVIASGRMTGAGAPAQWDTSRTTNDKDSTPCK